MSESENIRFLFAMGLAAGTVLLVAIFTVRAIWRSTRQRKRKQRWQRHED